MPWTVKDITILVLWLEKRFSNNNNTLSYIHLTYYVDYFEGIEMGILNAIRDWNNRRKKPSLLRISTIFKIGIPNKIVWKFQLRERVFGFW